MTGIQLLDLADELLEAIITQISCASETVHFSLVCKRLHRLVIASPAWRRHCLATWVIWDSSHDIDTKIAQKPLETDWYALYLQRIRTDRRASQLFESLLATQRARGPRMHELALIGYDVKDQLVGLFEDTPDEADDVLARRWHADAILRMMSRRQAVDIWRRLQDGEHVELEDALGAYDLFVLGSTPEFIHSHLDALATAVRESTRGFSDMTIREKAVAVCRHLRSKGIVGMADMEEYHALRNNFLSLPLAGYQEADEKGCLPLQSVAIFCGVARRLGIHAQPSNFPGNVHAVITAPPDITLDGEPRTAEEDLNRNLETMMHMDPFNQDGEVAPAQLLGRLSHIGMPPEQQAEALGPANVLEMVLRAGRNILVSVDGQRMPGQDVPNEEEEEQFPDAATSKYAALWSHFINGDTEPALSRIRRGQAAQVLLPRVLADFTQDLDMFAQVASKSLDGLPELVELIVAYSVDPQRVAAKVPVPRPAVDTDPVQYRIGTHFVHGRHNYHGFIVGWCPNCTASEHWIAQMRVDQLPRGRNQPFYNVM